jgi:hypothetical protein
MQAFHDAKAPHTRAFRRTWIRWQAFPPPFCKVAGVGSAGRTSLVNRDHDRYAVPVYL